MKNLLLVLLAVFLFSCNTEQKTNETPKETSVNASENALLYTDVTIKQEINFFPEMNPDWTESLVKSNLLKKLVDGALSGKNVFNYDDLSMSVQEVKTSLGQSVDTVFIEDLETHEMEMKVVINKFKPEQIIGIFFKENWSMDKDLTSFTKTIKEYSVVRQYKTDSTFEKSRTVKALTFKLYNNHKTNKYKTIAKDVFTEFYFYQENQDFIQGLNTRGLIDAILKYVVAGNKLYSFNDPKQELNYADLKEQLGMVTDTLYIENLETGDFEVKITEDFADRDNIEGLVFIEDWQYDEETMMINKVVTGIAPIWHKMEISDTGDVMETNALPFVIKF